jgi:hypothetical protein
LWVIVLQIFRAYGAAVGRAEAASPVGQSGSDGGGVPLWHHPGQNRSSKPIPSNWLVLTGTLFLSKNATF